MRIILEILLNDYHLCLTRFPLNSPEYRTLKNGIQVRNNRGEEVIHILCDVEMAAAVRNLFAQACPEALERIREIPEDDRD